MELPPIFSAHTNERTLAGVEAVGETAGPGDFGLLRVKTNRQQGFLIW